MLCHKVGDFPRWKHHTWGKSHSWKFDKIDSCMLNTVDILIIRTYDKRKTDWNNSKDIEYRFGFRFLVAAKKTGNRNLDRLYQGRAGKIIMWVVYLVRCSDTTLYCGVTNDLDRRLTAHNEGRGAKYTKSRRPVELVAASPNMPKREAFKLEYRVKQLPSHKKQTALAADDGWE